MDITTPLRHPVSTGLKALGWSIGMVRGAAVTAAALVMRDREDVAPQPVDDTSTPSAVPEPGPRTQVPGDLPTPTDLSQRVSPGDDAITPVGTPAAGTAYNPDTTDTDLQQPDTEPLMDPATTKTIAAEAETGARGADLDKG